MSTQSPGGSSGGAKMSVPPPPKAPMVKFKAALRRAKRRNAREPEIDFLNITAMLDLMTIVLVFVLKSLASSTASIPQSADLTLPQSVLTSEPAQDGIIIRISKTQIVVGDESTPIAEYSNRDQLGQYGLDAKYKRNGINDLFIQPLATVLARYRERDKLIREAKGQRADVSEAIIVADETTPYRLLFEVLYTCGQSEFGKFHLMVRTGKKS